MSTQDMDASRSAVVTACRHLASAGLSPGSSGNVSMRAGDGILVTPTGSALSRLREGDLAYVDGGGAAVRPDGPAPSGPAPSKEAPLHEAVYRLRPDAGAVVHLHSPYATAVACLPADADGHAHLPALTPYRVMRLGDVPLVPYAPPGSDALAGGVASVIAEHAVILLAHHGCVVAGPTLESAVDLAEELETAAQLTLLLRGTPAAPLTSGEVAALRERAGTRSHHSTPDTHGKSS